LLLLKNKGAGMIDLLAKLAASGIKPKLSLQRKVFAQLDAIEKALESGYTIKQVAENMGYEHPVFSSALFRARAQKLDVKTKRTERTRK